MYAISHRDPHATWMLQNCYNSCKATRTRSYRPFLVFCVRLLIGACKINRMGQYWGLGLQTGAPLTCTFVHLSALTCTLVHLCALICTFVVLWSFIGAYKYFRAHHTQCVLGLRNNINTTSSVNSASTINSTICSAMYVTQQHGCHAATWLPPCVGCQKQSHAA